MNIKKLRKQKGGLNSIELKNMQNNIQLPEQKTNNLQTYKETFEINNKNNN